MRKMCTVPFSLDAASNSPRAQLSPPPPAAAAAAEEEEEEEEEAAEDGPNASDLIDADSVPRRHVYTLCARGRQWTRMTVPFSDAEASKVPSGVRDTAARGELCAGTSHTTWRLTQS